MSCSVCAGHDTYCCPCCSEELDVVACPECGGEGYTDFKAFNIKTRKFVDVTPETYCALPDDENVALANGRNYCQGDAKECRFCGGRGEVYQDSRGEYHKMI